MAALSGYFSDVKRAVRSYCPQTLLNWREARFYGRYGEVELHLLGLLCRPTADAIDVGANDGSYIHYLRRHVRRVVAYEPMPERVEALHRKFRRGVAIERLALSDRIGTIDLKTPVIDGIAIEGWSTISNCASSTYPACRGVEVAMDRLDNAYRGDASFIKIGVEGHEQAVLDGAIETVRRCRPCMLVEVLEHLSPGGVARARAYFDALGYCGYFVHDGFLRPIDQFSVERMQDPANHPSLTTTPMARQRFDRFIYNFIFVPREEAEPIVAGLVGRLAELRQDDDDG
ncbi:MAG: FkbM family methyltransferase [Proteobacteria bacterium]|nr:FkbM family methyltransferase [Pseudomonadota bacterium]